MIAKRPRRTNRNHFALLINRAAAGYQEALISKLIGAISKAGESYTVYEPASALDLLRQSEVACGLRRATSDLPRPYEKAGKVTALIACGGDGTFNLAARAAWRTDLPIGLYPMGRLNNIARSLYGGVDTDNAIKHFLEGRSTQADVGMAGNLPFYGSVGLGFTERLAEELSRRNPPRFAIGWSQLSAEVAAKVTPEKIVLRVDSFRFEIAPLMLNINLLAYSAGLPLTPPSIAGDGFAEIVFDVGPTAGHFSSFVRLIHKKKYLYGDDFRLYRGRSIMMQPVKGRVLCLDGEPVAVPAETLEIKIEDKKLHILH
jgi:diacylglycerol kinase family enzyme